METKEKLEATIEGLRNKVNELTKEMQVAQATLEDANKPTITESQMEIISNAVHDRVGNYMSNLDGNDFDTEFELESGNRIELYSISFDSSDVLSDEIVDEISSKFREVEDVEENV
jgi:hypothetical protein